MGISGFCINEGVSWDLCDLSNNWSINDFNRFTGAFLSETEILHNSTKKLREMDFSDPSILNFCNSILDKLCYYNSTFLRKFVYMYLTDQYPNGAGGNPNDILNKTRKVFILNKDKLMTSPLKYNYSWIYTVFNENQGSIYGVFDSMKNSHYTDRILPIPSIFETVDGKLANWSMDDYMSAIHSINPNMAKDISHEDGRSISLTDIKYDLYRDMDYYVKPESDRIDNMKDFDEQVAKGIKLRKMMVYSIASEYQDFTLPDAVDDIKKIVLSIINYVYISAFLAKSKLDCINNAIERDNARSKMLCDFISSVNNNPE